MIQDKVGYKTLWTIRRYADDAAFAADKPFKVSEIEGNLLLNEGIGELLLLLTGGAGTAYSNANAYLGVGEDATAEDATDTDLIGAGKTYKAMEATYPQISAQTVTFRSVFASGDANIDWEEFTVSNSADGTTENLNRKTSPQGTKVGGQTWTLDLAITFS